MICLFVSHVHFFSFYRMETKGADGKQYNFKFCGNVIPKRQNVTLVQKKDEDVISLGLYTHTLVTSGGESSTVECFVDLFFVKKPGNAVQSKITVA